MYSNGAQVFSVLLLLLFLPNAIVSLGPGQLGIVFNEDLATKPAHAPLKKIVFNSIIEFKTWQADNALSDEQLAGIARQAFADMKAKFKETDLKKFGIQKRVKESPFVMVAMTKGKKVYLSSSMKSGGDDATSTAYLQTYRELSVYTALLECQARSEDDSEHRRSGNCAEVITAQLAFVNGETDLKGSVVIIATSLNNRSCD